MGYEMLSNGAKGERISEKLTEAERGLWSLKFEVVRSQEAGAIN
jgi:hypothetical protein